MCLQLPSQVVLVKEKKAKIKQGNHSRWVDISPVKEKIKKGDYLIVYQDVAINKIPSDEVEKIVSLIQEPIN